MPAAGSSGPLLVNPSNPFTGTFSVDKIFNRGILSLSGSVDRTDYENQGLQHFKICRIRGLERSRKMPHSGLVRCSMHILTVPSRRCDDATSDLSGASSTTSYRVIGGLGTRQFGLFRGSVYFGHQGSEGGGASAGGNVYGGDSSYYPTPALDVHWNGRQNNQHRVATICDQIWL